jgi:cytochrome c-type biogenesis protein CcmE
MTRKQKRLSIIGGALVFMGVAVALVLFALRQEIVFFHSPSDLQANPVRAGERIRLGGLVEKGSIDRGTDTKVAFAVTDTEHSVTVRYEGILPDLFREEQGVVTEGVFTSDGTFIADTVLAKHDENYMPKEVADALKDKGVWQGNE